MKRFIALAAVSTAFIAGPASAQLYLGVGAGEPRPDHSEVSWKALVGMQVTPMFGGEVAYHNFGEEGNADFDAESVAGTGTMALDRNWALVGKVGVVRLHAGPADDTNLYLGAGIRYALTPNVGLSLDYENFGKATRLGTDNRLSNVGLNAQYIF